MQKSKLVAVANLKMAITVIATVWAVIFGFLWGQANATPLTTTMLYQEENRQFDSLRLAGNTDFLSFQSLSRVELVEFVTFGEPVNYSPTPHFALQLFRTTPDWDTPNGNGDRIFGVINNAGVQFFYPDLGRAEYSFPIGVILEKDAYYRLSLQNVHGDWIQPFHTIETLAPFTTSDGLFQVFGIGAAFSGGPFPTRSSTYLFRTQTISEPTTLAIFALGLAGLGFARRKRAT